MPAAPEQNWESLSVGIGKKETAHSTARRGRLSITLRSVLQPSELHLEYHDIDLPTRNREPAGDNKFVFDRGYRLMEQSLFRATTLSSPLKRSVVESLFGVPWDPRFTSRRRPDPAALG
jgi:hypothetical protein